MLSLTPDTRFEFGSHLRALFYVLSKDHKFKVSSPAATFKWFKHVRLLPMHNEYEYTNPYFLYFTGKGLTMHVWISVTLFGSPVPCCRGARKSNWWMAMVSVISEFYLLSKIYRCWHRGAPILLSSIRQVWVWSNANWKYVLNRLRQDIIDLGKPRLQTEYKLIVISRMERVYECLLPSLKRQ